ncbi:hypothetical protein M8J76_017155 [Diaphorina citri]|nr:hypothetical protein M8J76_009129 [Diaphorina citri]KAI5709401.1 hypothetical protein M8J76_017155 [Diaphorina citri]
MYTSKDMDQIETAPAFPKGQITLATPESSSETEPSSDEAESNVAANRLDKTAKSGVRNDTSDLKTRRENGETKGQTSAVKSNSSAVRTLRENGETKSDTGALKTERGNLETDLDAVDTKSAGSAIAIGENADKATPEMDEKDHKRKRDVDRPKSRPSRETSNERGNTRHSKGALDGRKNRPESAKRNRQKDASPPKKSREKDASDKDDKRNTDVDSAKRSGKDGFKRNRNDAKETSETVGKVQKSDVNDARTVGKREVLQRNRETAEVLQRNRETVGMKDISELLSQVKEDVVIGTANPDSGVYVIEDHMTTGASLGNAPSPRLDQSQLEHRSFVQLRRGFVQTRYDGTAPHFDAEGGGTRSGPGGFSLSLNSPLDVAMVIQAGFQAGADICHGLLGGVSLFQLILVWFIESSDSPGGASRPSLPSSPLNIFTRQDNPSFLEDMQGPVPPPLYPTRHLSVLSYASMAFLPPALSILLLLICIVSVLDRYDISSNLSWGHLVHLATFRKSALCVALYSVSLLTCLICYKYDEMFVYMSNYPNDLGFVKASSFKSQDLLTWKQLSVLRSGLSLLAWIILALSHPQDMLQHNLQSIQTYETRDKPEPKYDTKPALKQ